MAKTTSKPGDVISILAKNALGKEVTRPLLVTSLNKDGTVNGEVFFEPGDNPNNDGNFKTFRSNVEA